MSVKKSYWVKNGKLTMLQRISMLVFGGGGFYLLVRTVNKEEYGVWMLYISISTLLITAREGFLKKPLIRYLHALEEDKRMPLQRTAFILNILFSLVTGVLLVAFSGLMSRMWEAPGLGTLFLIYFVNNLFLASFSHYNNVQEAYFHFKGPLVGNALKSGVLFFCIAYFFFTKTEVNVVILGYCDLAASALAALGSYLMSPELFPFRFGWDKVWAKKLFGYGKYTLGTNLSGMVLRNVDTWMLGIYISPVAVAVYNVAIRIANLFEVPTMAMASMLFPQAVKKAQSEGEGALKELYEKSVTVILIFVIPFSLGVILFSDQIIWLMAGEDYQEASDILKITMLYGIIIPFNKQMGVLLDAIGKAKLNMFFVIRNAIINVILNAWFIPHYGVIGAAYATLLSFVIIMVINSIYLRRRYQVDLRNLFYYSRTYFFKIRNSVLSRV